MNEAQKHQYVLVKQPFSFVALQRGYLLKSVIQLVLQVQLVALSWGQVDVGTYVKSINMPLFSGDYGYV